MSYSQVLNANSNMFMKAQDMLNLNSKNVAYQKGLSAEEIERQETQDLINNKIRILVEEKQRALAELEKDYNRTTKEMADKIYNTVATDLLISNQNKEIDRNTNKLNNIKHDVLTMRRQLEISENEYRKKTFLIFFLKNIFVFTLLSILVALLVKNGNISNNIAIVVEGVLVALMSGILLYNLYINRYRNSHYFNKMNWRSPGIPKD